MRLELNGTVTCELANHGRFINVKVPVRLTEGAAKLNAVLRYYMGDFTGRETSWPLHGYRETRLAFRIPQEVFREEGRLKLQVLTREELAMKTVLWSETYVGHWAKSTPWLESASTK